MFKNIFLFASLCFNYQNILSREEQKPLYRIRTPKEWTKKDFDSHLDTKIPLCEFLIKENDHNIRITIHNFPVSSLEERVSPIAQINRWKSQFDQINYETLKIVPQSFSGYSGYLLECTGIIDKKKITFLAWVLQLGSAHIKTLSNQIKADVTIKATGDADLIEAYREKIISFARSFELIEELPENS